jgi:predicted phage terminase large subunit-like protein
MFSCLYLNTPVRVEDMMFRSAWFQYYDSPPTNRSMSIFTTVDPATDPTLSKTGDTDYSVVMTCGKDMYTGYIYVLDYFREKCSPGELAAAIFDHAQRYHPIMVGYEDVAFQRSIDYWLKELMRQSGVHFIIEPIARSGHDAKAKAIAGLQPIFASHSIFLRPHMKELEAELIKFPLGKNDDLPDALAMQINLWRVTRTAEKAATFKYVNPLDASLAFDEIKSRSRGLLAARVFDTMSTSNVF